MVITSVVPIKLPAKLFNTSSSNAIQHRKAHCMYTTKYTVGTSITQTFAITSPQPKIQVLTRGPYLSNMIEIFHVNFYSLLNISLCSSQTLNPTCIASLRSAPCLILYGTFVLILSLSKLLTADLLSGVPI